MNPLPDLYHWLRAHSSLRLSDLGAEGFTAAEISGASARIVRVDLDDEVLERTGPILEAQWRDQLLPGEDEPSRPAWAALDRYLGKTIRTMPSQVRRLVLTPEGSLRMSA